MTSIVPNLTEQGPHTLGLPAARWDALFVHAVDGMLIRLPRLTATQVNALSAEDKLSAITLREGGLFVGPSRLAFEADVLPTRQVLDRFFGPNIDQGVVGIYPHIDAGYDTLMSLVHKLQSLELGETLAVAQIGADLAVLDERVATLEAAPGGGGVTLLGALDDVNVVDATTGQFLQKKLDGTWGAGSPGDAVADGEVGTVQTASASGEFVDAGVVIVDGGDYTDVGIPAERAVRLVRASGTAALDVVFGADDVSLTRTMSALDTRVTSLEAGGGGGGFPPIGEEGAIQAAGKKDAGFALTPIRGAFNIESAPAYTLESTPIVFDDSASSFTALQLNHAHTFSVRSDAVHSSGVWAVPSAAVPGDALSLYVDTFGISPDFQLQIGFARDMTTGVPLLRYVSSPDDTSVFISNDATLSNLRLTDALQEGKTYSFWYADEGGGNTIWYYSENGFPSALSFSGAIVEPLRPAGSDYNGTAFPVVNLGSPINRFGTLYLMGNTIDLGGTQLSTTEEGQLVVSADGGTAEPFATETFVAAAVNNSEATLTALIASKADAAALTAEIAARTSGDDALNARIDAEAAARDAAVSSINAALGTYVTASSHSADLALKLSVDSFASYVGGTLNTELAALGTSISALQASKQDKFSIGAGLELSDAGTLSAAAVDLSGYATTAALDAAAASAQTYTDNKFNLLVGSGTLSAALDTFVEIAGAIGTNQDAVTAINSAILTKADKSVTIDAGDGIVTSGSLGSGVNVSLETVGAGTLTTYGSSTAVPVVTVDKYGRVIAASTAAILEGFSGDYNDLINAPTLSNYATAASLNAVSGRVGTLEDAGFLTSASTISAARLDQRSFTITTPNIDDVDIVVALGSAVTAASLAAALSEPLDIRRSLAGLSDVDVSGATLVDGQYLKYSSGIWVAGSVSDFTTGVTSVNGESGAVVLDLDFVTPDALSAALADYATSVSLSAAVTALEDDLALKLTEAAFGAHVTALGVTLARKADVDTLSAFTASYAAYQQSTSTQLSALGVSLSSLSSAVDAVSATLVNYATSTTVSASISGLSTQISVINAALTAEITARGEADSALQADIAEEVTNRTTAVADLVGAVAGKQDSFAVGLGLTLSEGTLQTSFDISDYATTIDLATEVADIGSALDLKLSADAFNAYVSGTLSSDLGGKLDVSAFSAFTTSNSAVIAQVSADVSSVGVGVSGLADSLEAYTFTTDGRLAAVEAGASSLSDASAALQASLSAEGSARAAADATLQDNLDAEAAARLNGDDALSSDITDEANARVAADTTLQGNLDTEAAARAVADTTLQNNITAEASARADAVGAEADARSAADAALQDNLDAEETARVSADNTLNGLIIAEATSRSDADAALQASIAAEASSRSDADLSLQDAIDNEASARAAAISAEAASRSAADTAESSARASGDSDLRDAIDAEASTRASEDSSLQDAITAEAAARSNAVSALSTALTAEASNRASADSELSDLISAALVSSGLSAAGAYVADGGAAYISGAASLAEADSALDAQLSANTSDISSLSDRAASLEGNSAVVSSAVLTARTGGVWSQNESEVLYSPSDIVVRHSYGAWALSLQSSDIIFTAPTGGPGDRHWLYDTDNPGDLIFTGEA
jgi:hypothetical protein